MSALPIDSSDLARETAGVASKPSQTIAITLAQRTFKLRVDEADYANVMEAIALLEDAVQQVQQEQKLVSTDRLFMMAALSIANEHIQLKAGGSNVSVSELRRRLRRLNKQLDDVLSPQETLF